MRRFLCILLALTCLGLCGCSAEPAEPKEGEYALYFREADLNAAAGGDALRPEYRAIAEGDTEATVQALVEALLAGPSDATLAPLIPTGTALLSTRVNGSRAEVDFSSIYGFLSGVDLTLADYSIALTLTQLPEILSVRVTVRGQDLEYREASVLRARDVLLSPAGDVVSRLPVTLYFYDEEGSLQPDQQTLELYEGDTPAGAVLSALENGPSSGQLLPLFPVDFRVRLGGTEDAVCYVNVSALLMEEMADPAQVPAILEAVGASLCSLESIEEVRFLLDGEYLPDAPVLGVPNPYTAP